MRFYKSTENDIIVCINTLDADGDGNITELEYTVLSEMLAEMPTGKRIRDHGDGTYSYEDAPPMPEPDVEPEEALAILLGEES